MSDSELTVESLGTIAADDVNKYDNAVQYAIVAWCCVGGAAMVLGVFLLAFGYLSYTVIPVVILVYMCLATVVRKVETKQVREVVEDKLVPQVKQLQASIMELQKWLAADPVLLERLQANNGLVIQCSKAIRRMISDSEVVVKSLKSIVDDIDRHNELVDFGRILGYSMQMGGGVVAVSGIIGLFKHGIAEFEYTRNMISGTSLLVFGMVFIKVFNTEQYFETKRIIENQVVPLMKKLRGSIKELQTQWKDVGGVCSTLCVSRPNQMIQPNCSPDVSQTTTTSVKSLANILHSIREFVRDKKRPTSEQIISHLLLWLQQQIKELKNAEQQLNKTATKINDITTDQQLHNLV